CYTARGRRAGCPHCNKIKNLIELRSKYRVNQRDKEEDKKLLYLGAPEPRVRVEHIGQDRPDEQSQKRNPDSWKRKFPLKYEEQENACAEEYLAGGDRDLNQARGGDGDYQKDTVASLR